MYEFRSVNEKLAIDLMGLPYVKIPRYTLNLLKCPATRQLGQLHILLFDICFFCRWLCQIERTEGSMQKRRVCRYATGISRLVRYQHRFDQSLDPQVGSPPSDLRY